MVNDMTVLTSSSDDLLDSHTSMSRASNLSLCQRYYRDAVILIALWQSIRTASRGNQLLRVAIITAYVTASAVYRD